MKIRQIGIILSLLLIILLAGCSQMPTGKVVDISKDEPIKIGLLMPLTGDASSWGVEVKKGADLAYDKIKDEKINGQKIELIYEDSQCSGRMGVSAVTKLIKANNIKLTGGTVCSATVLSMAPILESNKIIHLSAAASSPEITSAGDHIFRLWPSDSYEAGIMADYSIKNLKTKTASILYLNNDYGVAFKNAFEDKFTELRGEIISSESFEVNANDFKTQLIKIKSAEPELLYIIANPAEGSIIIKQLRELGLIQTILMNGPLVESEGFLEETGNLAEGIIYAVPKTVISEEYAKAYQEKYGVDKGYISDVGYDVVMLLFKAIEYCQGKNPDCVKGYLYSIQNYQGASGTISFDENGDVLKDFVVKTIKNNEPVIIN